MSKGPIAMMALLGIISLIVVIIAATFLAVSKVAPEGGESLSFVEGAWQSLMRTMDAGRVVSLDAFKEKHQQLEVKGR